MSPNTGYNDAYDLQVLKKTLHGLGYGLHYSPKVDSTMKIIDEYAHKREKSAIAALTDHQIEGEGRAGRIWIDSAGKSLMFSVLFHIPQSSIATFADLIALSICQTLRKETGLYIKIKYPNDIVYEDKKLGGILVKNIYDDKLEYLGTNAGIGLNIHYSSEELMKFQTDYPAVSLDNYLSNTVKRQDLFIEILKGLRYFGTETEVIEKNPTARENFEKQWHEFSSVLGRKIAIIKNGTIISQGQVTDTEIGRGIELQTEKEKKWFSLFDSDMKTRILS